MASRTVWASARAVAAPQSPGWAIGEIVVDGDPLLPGVGVEAQRLGLLAGEPHRGGDAPADAVEVGVGERAAERQLLAALDRDEHEAVEEAVSQLSAGDVAEQLLLGDVADPDVGAGRAQRRVAHHRLKRRSTRKDGECGPSAFSRLRHCDAGRTPGEQARTPDGNAGDNARACCSGRGRPRRQVVESRWKS
jgi:hypothetical protein